MAVVAVCAVAGAGRSVGVALLAAVVDALEATAHISELLSIPVIASGGAGNMEHFYDVFTTGKADAGLAASIFHFNEIGIGDLKGYLGEKGVVVRR